jgi:N6-L-threonylcarbamoyladenine synthase
MKSSAKFKFMKNQTPKTLPLILAIDTSCDETSAAVTLGRVVLSNIIASQTNIHEPYGGVFPTLAKKAHTQNIKPVVQKTLKLAGVNFKDLDAVAVTLGPGLAPALEVGIEYAQKLARKWHKSIIGVNHIEAHVLSVLAGRNKRSFPTKKILELKRQNKLIPPNLKSQLPAFTQASLNQQLDLFPSVSVVVSGGHSQFVLVNKINDYQIMGQTIDDALGEALDKVGRMLGLGYPAAPVMEKMAKQGDPNQFNFPLPMTTSDDFNLSYSGLKTAAHRLIKQLEKDDQLNQQAIINLAASFQAAAFKHLIYKLDKLLQDLINQKQIKIQQIWLGGGVARNIQLRQKIRSLIKTHNLKLKTPFEKRLCSDNAAMVGVTAGFHYPATEKIKLDRKPSWSIAEK